MNSSSSLFEKWIGRPRHPWINRGVVLACLVIPLLVAWAEGRTDRLLETGQWRAVLIPPAIIGYILAVAPAMASMDTRVVNSLQAQLHDDADPTRVVPVAGPMSAKNELVVFGGGVAFALLMNAGDLLAGFTWLGLSALPGVALMYGLLAVVIFGSIDTARLTGALLRQLPRVDPLDVSPFEAIGRQSLLLSLVFVGGITLSLLLVGISPSIFLRWEFWIIYTPLISVPVVVFFLNMAPTHRLLQSARDAELRRVLRLTRQACASLVGELERGESAVESAQRVSALTAYEARLLRARTWPYDTTMLRSLFLSILVPGATAIGRLVLQAIQR